MRAYREFTDSSGAEWRVYRVEPQSISPSLTRLRESLPRAESERRRPWLLFESNTGLRARLAPVPERWDENCTDEDLAKWCAAADPIPPAPMRRRADGQAGSDDNSST